MNLRKGSELWVEDQSLAWVAAEIIDFVGKQAQVVTVNGKKVLAAPEKLFLRDADDEEEHGGVDNITKLTYLNEPGVLYNLERRYALNDIYVPKTARVHAGKSSRSPGCNQHQSHISQWDNILKYLDSLMDRLCENHLEKWIINAKEEFVGTSWHELNYTRQAVGFLALKVRQIYPICTMYWDDKYGTRNVSNEVVAQMREMLNKDNQNLSSNSFLLDDDLT